MMQASTWHHHSPEPRIQLFPSFYVTIYDPFYPSIWAGNNPSVPPVDRTLTEVSLEDARRFKERVIEVVSRWSMDIHAESDVDWRGIAQTFQDRTERRLMAMKVTLQNYERTQELERTAQLISQIAFSILMPYTDYHAFDNKTNDDTRRDWIERANHTCSTIFTSHISRRLKFPWWQQRLLNVIQTIISSVCNFSSKALTVSLLTRKEDLMKEIQRVGRDLDMLIEYLQWPGWNRCERQCDWDEVCFVSVWPVEGRIPGRGPTEVKASCKKLEDVEMF
jgi:hypothetical protein